MRLIIFLLIICSYLFPFSAYSSVNCKDIEEIDNSNRLAGSLLYLVGCNAVSAEILSKEWNNFPKPAQVLLSRYYLVSDTKLMNWNDPRLSELIGNGSTLIQRLLALEYSSDTP